MKEIDINSATKEMVRDNIFGLVSSDFDCSFMEQSDSLADFALVQCGIDLQNDTIKSPSHRISEIVLKNVVLRHLVASKSIKFSRFALYEWRWWLSAMNNMSEPISEEESTGYMRAWMGSNEFTLIVMAGLYGLIHCDFDLETEKRTVTDISLESSTTKQYDYSVDLLKLLGLVKLFVECVRTDESVFFCALGSPQRTEQFNHILHQANSYLNDGSKWPAWIPNTTIYGIRSSVAQLVDIVNKATEMYKATQTGNVDDVDTIEETTKAQELLSKFFVMSSWNKELISIPNLVVLKKVILRGGNVALYIRNYNAIDVDETAAFVNDFIKINPKAITPAILNREVKPHPAAIEEEKALLVEMQDTLAKFE